MRKAPFLCLLCLVSVVSVPPCRFARAASDVELPVLPAAPRSGRSPDSEESIVVRISADGKFALDGKPVAADRLPGLLRRLAEVRRDERIPARPSTKCLMLEADAHAPWRLVRDTMRLCEDPEVRIRHVFWMVGVEGEEGAAPLDVSFRLGLTSRYGTVSLLRFEPAVVEIACSPGGECAFRRFGEPADAIEFRAVPDSPRPAGRIDAAADVPFGVVARTYAELGAAGWSASAGTVLPPRPLLSFAKSVSEKALEAARDEARFGSLDQAIADLEALVLPDAESRTERLAILENLEPSWEDLRTFGESAKADAAALEELARNYGERDAGRDGIRAVAITGLLLAFDAHKTWSAAWWDLVALHLEFLARWSEEHLDPAAADRVKAVVESLRRMGALEDSPVRYDLEAIEDRAEALGR